MAAFRRASTEPINAFKLDGRYVFRQYFDDNDVFTHLKGYYNNRQYRFEVPPEEFDDVQLFLDNKGYGLVIIDAPEAFVVVVKQYTDHPDDILKQSVSKRSFDGYNCFLLVDQAAVEEAVDHGAISLEDIGLENPF